MLVVEKHAFLEEVQLGVVCRAVFGVVGLSANFLTGGRFLELKLIIEEIEGRRHEKALWM